MTSSGGLSTFRAWKDKLRRPKTALETHYADLDLDLLEEQWKQALQGKQVDASLLLQVATLRDSRLRVGKAKRRLAETYHRPLLRAWIEKHPDHRVVALAPLAIIILDPQHVLRISLSPTGAPSFDWSEAQALLYRIDSLAERAGMWIHTPDERGPHVDRAYGLASQVLTAVQRQIWIHDRREPTPDELASFTAELAVLRTQTTAAERLFRLAAADSAQARYSVGMLVGGVGLLVFSAAIGAAFLHWNVEAAAAVAMPIGGLGAIISALQRMHSGNLQLDYQATAERLLRFGAIRPFIGAVFGMFLTALLYAGQLPALDVPTTVGGELAFFSVIGFLAGFNERFAQDVVSDSAKRLKPPSLAAADAP
jgi:hypothetical protein